ncbi:MAG: GntR family transcriptional regulator [Thalassobius sp.]|nr:GntR family transcriptional regulator [Thalassovita sp.]
MKAPRYKVVYEFLKKNIITGNYVEGHLLPSENELCAKFEVTRPTVRQALNALVQEKYIYKHRGKGSIVANQQRTLGLLSFKGFTEVLSNSEQTIETRILESKHLQDWPEDFFYPIPKNLRNSGCYFLKRLRCVNQEPVMLEYTWILDINLDGFDAISFENNSLFGTLASKFHVEVTSVDQQIKAIQADKQQAHMLQMEEKSALLHIYRKYGTSRNDFFLFSSLLCNTSNYAIGNVFS